MKLTFLGTGTSSGIPVIGCDCDVCTSTDPRNRRRRTSLYLQADGLHLVIDTPPDFREQAIEYRVPRVDAVLFTHAHADHVFGFDDIRRYNTIQDAVIPAYGSADTIRSLNRIFDYIRLEKMPGVYRPRIEYREVAEPFSIRGVQITPVPVVHGADPTLGYRFEWAGRSLGYVPDCKSMPDTSVDLLKGVDVMILDALRHRPHMTHLTVGDSVAVLRRIGARRSFIDHLCHDLDHETTRLELASDGIEVPFDGMTLEW
jgi:phosphoribosyl 1,2-cyclic phosphate phosphodiesterase